MNQQEPNLDDIFHNVGKDLEKMLPKFMEALNIYVQQEVHNIKKEAQDILDVISASKVE